eukprot:3636654-Amphidinium_carterae.1
MHASWQCRLMSASSALPNNSGRVSVTTWAQRAASSAALSAARRIRTSVAGESKDIVCALIDVLDCALQAFVVVCVCMKLPLSKSQVWRRVMLGRFLAIASVDVRPLEFNFPSPSSCSTTAKNVVLRNGSSCYGRVFMLLNS